MQIIKQLTLTKLVILSKLMYICKIEKTLTISAQLRSRTCLKNICHKILEHCISNLTGFSVTGCSRNEISTLTFFCSSLSQAVALDSCRNTEFADVNKHLVDLKNPTENCSNLKDHFS